MKTIVFTLTPAESKRLIGKGVAALPQVKAAKNNHRLIISTGTTNAYVAEELTGISLDKRRYTAGVITEGRWCVTPSEGRLDPICFEEGQQSTRSWLDVLCDFSGQDVFIKGGNAFDTSNNIGILLGNTFGGTIGKAIGIIAARGSHLIIPIGFEKLVPSVPKAASLLGIDSGNTTLGCRAGMMVISQGTVFTEISALESLCQVTATVVCAGGTGGSEGSVSIAASGTPKAVVACETLVRVIKGEANIEPWRRGCSSNCQPGCDY